MSNCKHVLDLAQHTFSIHKTNNEPKETKTKTSTKDDKKCKVEIPNYFTYARRNQIGFNDKRMKFQKVSSCFSACRFGHMETIYKYNFDNIKATQTAHNHL